MRSIPLALALTACSAQHTVGGKSAADVFPRPADAALADAACRAANHDIEAALRAGAEVNRAGYQGMTPLIWAITCENADGMELLLKRGADPNKSAEYDRYPVAIAASYSNPKILELLLRRGGNPNLAFSDGSTPLMEALKASIRDARLTNIEMLLKANANVNAKNRSGDDVVHLAVYLNQYEAALLLYRAGYTGDKSNLLAFAERARGTVTRKAAPAVERFIEAVNKE